MGKSSPHKEAILATCDKFPLASFIPTIFEILESSRHVVGSMLRPVLLGTLYKMIGKFTWLAIAW